MSKKNKWILIIIILAAVFTGIFYKLVKSAKKGVEVKTGNVSEGDITVYFSTTGNVESKNKKEYYIQSPVKVLKTNFNIGDNVKKGDVVAELETQDMSLQLKTAEKQLNIAELQLESLKEQKANAKNMKDQSQNVQQGSNVQPGSSVQPGSNMQQGSMGGSAPSVDIDKQIKIQENQVEIAKLNIESIKQSISNQQRYIKADFDGTITGMNIKAGDYVKPQVPAVVVEDIKNLQIAMNVNQYDINRIKAGQEAFVNYNNKKYKAVVSSISPSASKVTSQTGQDTVIKVTADLTENDGAIKSGFDVDVNIKTGGKKGILKVPAEAVITDKENNEKVYAVKDGIAKLTNIKTGLSSDTEYEVLEGLSKDETVILNPSMNVIDGVKVTIKDVK
ncbi:MAG TPA: efflux RND transporter periplasmic adaptor subunit [Clostridiaceae bacterium]|jgi:HlyD family secretion protein|nr:efflux RND transporter periplasmic adaptor subunit [Clostridiaceae bacterium]HBN28595.1 efflux RND transporter periplasmic adaptor subunit [Clostridiaceae bacterium]HBX48803.1 efflux RND transporter periplasmic adaptor subunit [Clostridiaceae bacterium]HCL50179.1 efflux RND transporter periplasmic adaptor subunit [Clostridiaceae bacterium]